MKTAKKMLSFAPNLVSNLKVTKKDKYKVNSLIMKMSRTIILLFYALSAVIALNRLKEQFVGKNQQTILLNCANFISLRLAVIRTLPQP